MSRYLIAILAVACASPARAIITMGGDGRLAVPPPGAYRDSGVQYTGNWGSFVGTAIGPRHFLTAAHVGGGVGDVFTLDKKHYVAEGLTVIPGTDLAVWRIRGRLPRWARLYDEYDETGREIVLYGRGCRRGKELLHGGVRRGWFWGESAPTLSWGRNRVEGRSVLSGGAEVIVFRFDQSGGDEEGTVGKGDSGGGVFLREGAEWKLAGVNYASGGQYSRSQTGGKPFMAALYDTRGIYQNASEGWRQNDPDGTDPAPTLAFATRVSAYARKLRAIVGATDRRSEAAPLSTRTILLYAAVVLAVILVLVSIRSRRLPRL